MILDENILETNRLKLRHISMADVPVYHSFFSDQETMRFYPATRSLEETKEFVKRQLRRYEKDGFGPWAVSLKSADLLLGYCGLINQTVDSKTELEIGYLIGRAYWRQGFASEAAIGCRDYAFHVLGFDRLISLIDPANVASIGVARKVGMKLEKQSFWQGKWMNVYSLKR
jgi:[ribosomal protein S5]-alanine N-acetyltransferase